ncbi:hypothetical protein CXQ85_003853 [Candidozyma haemuli]|uniref:tRNA pseudouridine(32) synthase n=1 Tax=Candidozyma haemuli TaxID=45357 RepID=A0A2V1B1B7_9ASCO|nr:hypothetical protein CXQ85_003853 [[Candida] haemuloni]PVH23563.1 hypothetical protein CXQ85_003853 [[Candida] haemuloni]
MTESGQKRASSPSGAPPSPVSKTRPPRGAKKQRDDHGFKMKQQAIDKDVLSSEAQPGKTIFEEETEGASYIIEGPLRRTTPYYFTYLTYCKQRWRDRKILDVFLDEFREKDGDIYRKAIASGQVTINKKPTTLDSVVKNGDLISHRCHRHEPAVSSRPIKIVFEDDNVIAIDKPSGIPVHPTGRYRYNTITKIFQHEYGKTVHPCNRLDRLTSGLMFLGKNAKGADFFVKQIRERNVRKEYIARVKGRFPVEPVSVDQPLYTASPKHALNVVDHENGKPAVTEFKRVSYDPASNTSIVKCHPLTGRTHQIRVHLQYIGHPIANDPIYSSGYVWGSDDLGKGNEGCPEEVVASVLYMVSSQEDGEILSKDQCSECEMPLHTDPGPNDLDLWLHAYKYEASDKSWSYTADYPDWAINPHRKFMELAIEQAKKCGETQTQFNVGAVLVLDGEVLATGHSRELPGNTHAEQCALEKYFKENNTTDVPKGTELFTTMEPCSFRLSGNLPCVDRILATSIKTCFVGILEPDTFVQNNTGKAKLTEAEVEYIHIPGYEDECLEIAKLGHDKKV